MSFIHAVRAFACLMGAAGVVASAAAAHGGGDTRMAAAAQILLVHAAATFALTLAPSSRALLAATALMQAGGVLFAADMAVRTLVDHALFPMAAPTGGVLLILAWLGAGVVTAIDRR